MIFENLPNEFSALNGEEITNDLLLNLIDNGFTYDLIPDEFKKDIYITIKFFTRDLYSLNKLKEFYKLIPKEVINNKDLYNNSSGNEFLFKKMPLKLKNDRDFCLEITKYKPFSIKFFSKKIRSDVEIMIQLIKQFPYILDYVPNELKNNAEFIMKLSQHAPICFNIISKTLKQDREFIINLFKNNKIITTFVPQCFRDDKEIVLLFINNHRVAYQKISKRLRYDRDIINKAIEKGISLQWLPCFFRKDKEIILKILKHYGCDLAITSQNLRNDKEVVLTAIKSCNYAFSYASIQLQNDREVVIEAIKYHTTVIYLGVNFMDDLEINVIWYLHHKNIMHANSYFENEQLKNLAINYDFYGRILNFNELRTKMWKKGGLAEDLMKNRFHPKNLNKFNDWGFD